MTIVKRKYMERTYDVATGQIAFPIAPLAEDFNASVVIAATWATAAIPIIPLLSPDYTGSSHNAEEALVEELQLKIGEIVEGVSVEVLAFAPNKTNGTYNVKIIGFT